MIAFLPVIKIVPTQPNVAAAWAQQPPSFLPSFHICETHTEVQLHQIHKRSSFSAKRRQQTASFPVTSLLS